MGNEEILKKEFLIHQNQNLKPNQKPNQKPNLRNKTRHEMAFHIVSHKYTHEVISSLKELIQRDIHTE